MEAHLADPLHQNWLKVGLAIKRTTHVLQHFCELHGRPFCTELLEVRFSAVLLWQRTCSMHRLPEQEWKSAPCSRGEARWTDDDVASISCNGSSNSPAEDYKVDLRLCYSHCS